MQKAWFLSKKKLTEKYLLKGITRCEKCGEGWRLSFHHLDKRSTGKAKHTLKETRLLCSRCHDLCEYDKEENEKLRKIR
jgi:hypothetical protein